MGAVAIECDVGEGGSFAHGVEFLGQNILLRYPAPV